MNDILFVWLSKITILLMLVSIWLTDENYGISGHIDQNVPLLTPLEYIINAMPVYF